MTTRICPRCDRQLDPAAYLCNREPRRLAADLTELAGLARTAITTVSRLDRHSTGGTRRSDIGLPVNLAAADRLSTVAVTVTSTARWVASTRGVPLNLARAPLPQAALWLRDHLDWLRHHPQGPARYDALSRATGTVRHLVDRPPERIYLGPCQVPDRHGQDCDADLYAQPGAAWSTCRVCGVQHQVADRRTWLRKVAREYAFTATDISSAYGVSASSIRTWAERGRIVATGRDHHGRWLYPLGPVLDLAAQAAARRATNESRRERISA